MASFCDELGGRDASLFAGNDADVVDIPVVGF